MNIVTFFTKAKSVLGRFYERVLIHSENPLRLTLSVLSVFLVVRMVEALSLYSQTTPMGFAHYLFGIQFDWLFASFLGVLSVPLFLFLPNTLNRGWIALLCGLVLLLGLITWGLSEYFILIRIPLDHSLLIYPISEIFYIVRTSVGVSFDQIIKGIVVVSSSIVIPWFLLKRVRLSTVTKSVLIALVLVTLLFVNNVTPNIARFESNNIFYQQINKASYLIKQLLVHFKSQQGYANADVQAVAKRFQEQNSQFSYLNPSYPFVRRNTDADVIGDYFEFGETKPHIVFVIVESLSREFSGPNPKLGSFTPFLDSLAEHSLYWSNFISTSERTFNVLPSSLASLPYGKKGFMALAENNNPYPDFLSLTSVLKQSGYQSNFFYGGWIDFDFISNFLRASEVNIALTDKKFHARYDEIQRTETGFTWGFPDHAVYLRAMEIIDSLPQQPRVDIYMSLSTHDPFFPPSPERWEAFLKQILDERGLKGKERDFYMERSEHFKTVLYADNSLKILLDEYRRRPEFENTIFIIYGDHYMPLGTATPIEKYHVPFLIYSPMLTQPKVFPAVSSTADITPTLLAMLKQEFDVSTPGWVHWLGSSLDTTSRFQSQKFVPFMRINRNVDEMLWGEYFYSEGRLFMVDENLIIHQIVDNAKLGEMEEMLNAFRALNDYTCTMNTIRVPGTGKLDN